MPYPEIPHLKTPINFSNGAAEVVEQDSIDDITQCVAAILSTPYGSRAELPDFGVLEFVFEQIDWSAGASFSDELISVIAEWEPRALILIESRPELVQQTLATLHERIEVRGDVDG